MKKAFENILKIALSLIVLEGLCTSASAQNTISKSRIAVISNGNSTKIWVSDFPKKTNIIITDSENNLLSVSSTNDFGTAYLVLTIAVKSNVVVKTLDGEIEVSNNVIVKGEKAEGKIVAAIPEVESIKA